MEHVKCGALKCIIPIQHHDPSFSSSQVRTARRTDMHSDISTDKLSDNSCCVNLQKCTTYHYANIQCKKSIQSQSLIIEEHHIYNP